jgi:biofilm PGA synthesis N-glycosyltransferase PgaC
LAELALPYMAVVTLYVPFHGAWAILRKISGAGHNRYLLISACRNESTYIDGLIETVVTQTLQPFRWVIVDDGSTDDTYARAATKGKDLAILQIAKMPNKGPRSFASQVYAAQHGYELVRHLEFEFIGFLDADIRLGADYYERLVGFFNAEPLLGLAGGAVIDQYQERAENVRQGSEDFHVAGGVQFFRRQCFEQIGGYVPIDGGGQDTIADIMVMMHGWRIRTIPEIKATHLRPEGFSKQNVFRRGLLWGRKFYLIGYHPVFYFGQCLRRITRHPVLLGSLCQLIGFVVASFGAEPRPVRKEFVQFLRKAQMQRLRRILR